METERERERERLEYKSKRERKWGEERWRAVERGRRESSGGSVHADTRRGARVVVKGESGSGRGVKREEEEEEEGISGVFGGQGKPVEA